MDLDVRPTELHQGGPHHRLGGVTGPIRSDHDLVSPSRLSTDGGGAAHHHAVSRMGYATAVM
jgi:hypothetical protein